MASELLICDLDNTLYDWNAFFAPSFRGMVHALSRESNVSEDVLYEEFKQVFTHHGSVEYTFSVQELPIFKSMSTEDVKRLISIARGTFRRVRAKRLRPYTSVPATLEWIKDQQIGLVGVTNAPLYLAQLRLWELKIDRFFDGLIAWEGNPTPAIGDKFVGDFIEPSTSRRLTRVKWCASVKSDARKPATDAYELALDKVGVEPSACWVVGDSLEKDLVPARKLGAKTVLAAYGKSVASKDIETLLRVTHWSDKEVDTHYTTSTFDPDYAIDSFDELTSILPHNIPTLF